MPDEQILELVKEHFTEGGIHDDGSCFEYYGDIDAFVKFARTIIKEHEKIREYNLGNDDYFNSWRE